jgi:hypothetical protein
LLALLAPAGAAGAAFDPHRTLTIYVHGFDLEGAGRTGTYGDVFHEALADSIAALAGLPVWPSFEEPLPSNAVLGVGYYGDSPPAWYSAADRAAVDSVTAAWGGGVPRYATIVAKFARHALARSGAQQVNFVSASFGSLVVRWLIEMNVEGLAGEGRIARWLTVEGVLGGNWAASHAPSFLDFLTLASVDLEHMKHDWIDARLHRPHAEADHPLYAGILIGEIASTDERYNGGALSALMASDRDWQPNDGVQALPDAVFAAVTARSRYQGRPPTRALFHATHFGLEHVRGAWAEAATFLTQRRRVTVTLTRATVSDLHEPDLPFWDWRPGEIVFESRVFSPAVAARWGVADPLCAYVEAGGAAPLSRYDRDGDTHTLDHVVFDAFVLPEETALDVDLRAYDVDLDPHYGVYETVSAPYLDDLGGVRVSVATTSGAAYAFTAGDWSGELAVSVMDYPFAVLTGVAAGPRPSAAPLALTPNPTRGAQRVVVPAAAAAGARLEIVDVSGRRVRHAATLPRAEFVWDGRDDAGRPVPAGVYLVRVVAARGVWQARSLVIR